MKSHEERLQAIFREFPRLKAAVDAGTMRVWVDDAGEHISLLSKGSHFAKRKFHGVPVEDDQHEEIKARAKELQDLIEEHPYLQRAIEDQWAKVVVQDDGNIGLEFSAGRSLHLHCFDEGDGAAKASRIKEKAMNGKRELTSLAQKHEPLAKAIADGWVKIRAEDDGELKLEFPHGDRASLSAFDEAASNVAKHSAGIPESEVRDRWVGALRNADLEKAFRLSSGGLLSETDEVGFPKAGF